MHNKMSTICCCLLIPCLLLSACSSDDDTSDIGIETETDTGTDTSESQVTVGQLDISRFADGALSTTPATVECTLSDGTPSTCYEIVTAPTPVGQTVGPFCPRTTTTDASDAGIWLDGSGTVYDIDGDFILNLPNIYGTTET